MAGGGLPWDLSRATLSLPAGQCRGTWMGVSLPWVKASQALFHPPPCRDPELLVGPHSPSRVPGLLSASHHRRPGQGSPWGQVARSSSLQASSCLCSVPASTQLAPWPATTDTCPCAGWLPPCSLWLSLAGRRGVSGTVPSFPAPASVSPPLAGTGRSLGAPGGHGQQGDTCRRGPLTRGGRPRSSAHLSPWPDTSRHNL